MVATLQALLEALAVLFLAAAFPAIASLEGDLEGARVPVADDLLGLLS